MTRAQEVQDEAYLAFNAWLSEQPWDVQEMELLDQVELYATAEEKQREQG